MNNFAPELALAKDISLKAGAIMLEYFDDPVVERKLDDSPVTLADKEINNLVIEEIGRNYTDGVIGEEASTANYGTGRRWVCDPIDGTRAFIWGVPTAMFSLALIVEGVPVLGVAYDPFMNLLYHAVSGNGSFLNGVAIRVSSEKITGADVGVSSSVSKILNDENQKILMQNLLDKKARLVAFSGAVYKGCLLARGKMDGYVEKNVNPHDVAAIEVIVKEAGGMVTGFDGKALDYTRMFKGAVISNSVIHSDLLQTVAHWK